jgi:hypothetical protein
VKHVPNGRIEAAPEFRSVPGGSFDPSADVGKGSDLSESYLVGERHGVSPPRFAALSLLNFIS